MTLANQEQIIEEISNELSLDISKVSNTVTLLADGNTVPFISRYRKEQTGNLTEIDVREINKWYETLINLYEHKEIVIRLIDEQGKLTEDTKLAIVNSKSLAQVDDIYAPFKKKRKTKSDIAKENGLEPLANFILAFNQGDPDELVKEFISENVKDSFDAYKGAVEIIAEKVGHDLATKNLVKENFSTAQINISIVDDLDKEDPKISVYKDYFEHNEPITTLAPHRLLALNRGEKEKILKIKIDIDEKDNLINEIKESFKPNKDSSSSLDKYYNRSIDLAYSKFLAPSNKAEIWREKKELAFLDAINVFTKNLESLLLTPPVSGYTIFGIDPGFRTGCKIAIISPLGKVLYTGVLYFTTPGKEQNALKEFESLLNEYSVSLISIGDGTASRETEELIANSQVRNSLDIPYLIVTEAGASIYSASEVASAEFPDMDVSLRGTVSIARRVQDPLAEYVKIDPWSIGVGQYQHDLPQSELKTALSETVESVVNRVGVEVNNASPQLLAYVSGISTRQAKAIHNHIQEHGSIKAREEILSIKGVGTKTYEQAAGFLRISNGLNPLDATGIHPESYEIAKEILNKISFSVEDLANSQQRVLLKRKLEKIDLDKLRKSISLKIGEFTFVDIIDGLKAPFRDPRESLDKPLLRNQVIDIDSVKIDAIVEGVIRNVTNFGAFVDIGLKQSGLVHISELANRFIKDPFEVVQPGDRIKAKVISIDKARNRIGLSMKQVAENSTNSRRQPVKKEGYSQKKTSGKRKFSLNELQKRYR